MNIVPVFWKALPSLRATHRTVLRCAAFAGLAAFLIYVVGNTVSFIVQLFELSSAEVSKFIKVITALLNRPNLDLEFLPQEFEDLTPSPEGVYSYAPGNYHPILFRRASEEADKGAWQWSDDGRQWFATDSFRESPNGVPEPPALVFILRLHVEHLIRCRLANPAAVHRRLPPPLDFDACPRARLDAAPEPLCCPISHGVMRLPVVSPSGTTFEYDCIRRWAQRHNTDPVNGAPLSEGDLYPNLALRDIIDRWVRRQQPGRKQQQGETQQQRPQQQEQQQRGQEEAAAVRGSTGGEWKGEGEERAEADGQARVEGGAGCGPAGQPLTAEAVRQDPPPDGAARGCLSAAPEGQQEQQQPQLTTQPLPPHLVDLS